MTTLKEYAETHFPNHVTEQSGPDRPLADHTAVAHVIGSDKGIELVQRVQQAMPGADVASVMVRPTDPKVVPVGGEDPEGVVDLPYRRVAAAGAVGAVVVGTVVAVIVGLTSDSAWSAVIAGVFAAVLAGAVSAIAGGGARFGGERAWEQPHAPDQTVAVVAAFAATEQDAITAARIMDELNPYEVRIVAANGAWHSPNT